MAEVQEGLGRKVSEHTENGVDTRESEKHIKHKDYTR